MKAYLVMYSSGQYDDYSEWIDKAYFDKEKAEQHKSNFNNYLESENKKYKKCIECPIKCLDFYPLKNVQKSDIMNSCKYYCELFEDIQNDPYCKNRVQYSTEYHEATIKEIDIE